jgi:hypothetical protein
MEGKIGAGMLLFLPSRLHDCNCDCILSQSIPLNAMDFDIDDGDDFSTAMGIETLAARDMVPRGFEAFPYPPYAGPSIYLPA